MYKVLMFHRILPKIKIPKKCAYSDFGTLISQEYFEEILQLILNLNIEVVTISELTELINHKKDIHNYIALTFDDGYFDNYEYAFPLLEKYKMKGTFFPITKSCLKNNVLPLDIYYQCVDETNLSEKEREEYIKGKIKKDFYWTEPELQYQKLRNIFKTTVNKSRIKYMNEKHLIELSKKGHEIGSHSVTHSLFTADYMDVNKIIFELRKSKEDLEKIINKQVKTFCFPAGRYYYENIEMAEKIGYTSTCLVYSNSKEQYKIPSYERYFVTPNSISELKNILMDL